MMTLVCCLVFCVLLVVLIWKDDVKNRNVDVYSSWSLVEFLTHFSQVYEHELCKSASFAPSFRKMYQMWTKIISSYSYLTEIMFASSVVHISPYNSQNGIWPSMWLKTNTRNVLKSKMVSKNHIESNICCFLLCKWSLPVFHLIQKELQKKRVAEENSPKNSLRASDRRPGVVYLLTSSSCSNWRNVTRCLKNIRVVVTLQGEPLGFLNGVISPYKWHYKWVTGAPCFQIHIGEGFPRTVCWNTWM